MNKVLTHSAIASITVVLKLHSTLTPASSKFESVLFVDIWYQLAAEI